MVMIYGLWMNKILILFKRFDFEWDLCSFAWSKEPKIKAAELLLKRSFRMLLEIFASRRFILFATEKLILPAIFFEASDKSLAFQFTLKTQQFQGQINYYELRLFWFMNYRN